MTPARAALVAAVPALALGVGAGWYARGTPPPATRQASAERTTAQTTTSSLVGPTRTTVLEYLPGPPAAAPAVRWRDRPVPGPERRVEVPGPERLVEVPGPERLVRVTVTEAGPVSTTSSSSTTAERKAEVVVTPVPPLPRWMLGWEPQLAPRPDLLRAVAGVRVVGPLWAAAWVAPAQPAAGVGLLLTF